MKYSRIAMLSVLPLATVYLFRCLNPTPAKAMPMFSRKLGVPCETCHTTIPRLNETGYKFRAAGFRFPEIGRAHV